MFEASMNFDAENVDPFLTEMDARLHLGLPVVDLVRTVRAVEIDHAESQHLQVTYDGAKVSLEFRVFMDDIDAPDLYFVSNSEQLINAIQAEMTRFAEARGM